jgi:hypothetical protein
MRQGLQEGDQGVEDGGGTGNRRWWGCEKRVTWEYASLSGALNPIELVPYVRLCIMLRHISVSNSKTFLCFATLCQS